VTHEPQAITKPGGNQCMARELEKREERRGGEGNG
jgi:hypothetical protein